MRIPRLCHQKSDGRAFVTVPRTGGKRVYFGKFGTPEAEAAYKEWLVKVLAFKPSDLGIQQSLASVCIEYVEWCRVQSQATYRANRKACEFLLRQYIHLSASAYTAPVVLQWLETMDGGSYETKKGKVKYHTRTYLNKLLHHLKRLAKWGEARGYFPAGTHASISTVDPLKKGKSKSREAPKVKPIAWDIVSQTLPELSETVAAMVKVQYLSGMRPGEIRKMRRGEIDDSRDIWLYVPLQHKTTHHGAELIKAIPKPAQDILRPFLEACECEESFVFNSRRGCPYTTHGYITAIKRACERLGLPVWKPNQLRHSIATHVREKHGIEASSLYLGHASTNMTEIYAERSVAQIVDIARTLNFPTTG